MTDVEILPLLQVDLGELYPSPPRRDYLLQCIAAARAFLAREGVTFTGSAEDAQLLEMYAAYLVRKRASSEPMPRMLRWAMNNRIFGAKAGESHAP